MIAILLAAVAACQAPSATGSAPAVNIDALRWLDPSADPVAHLTVQPATCQTAPVSPSAQRGALLFSSPLLLGGQAAKAGLSCASCHRNGRGNSAFLFMGISGAPGTADVTHGLFSTVRADETFNPVPIPDLATAEGRTRVDREQAGVLETFLTAQIVEEFSGTAPESVVIDDLAAYIRTLDTAACAPNTIEAQSWRAELSLLRAGLIAPDVRSGSYKDAMRAALGRLYERYPGQQHADLRTDLIQLSRVLADGNPPEDIGQTLDQLAEQLAGAEAGSLYSPEVLSRALR
ncbi:MAG: hypothetical protein NXH78_16395 [Hyphomonadaceae bacterium]|nr:hypothetical protein [Hyphomonadaceae bacterium]